MDVLVAGVAAAGASDRGVGARGAGTERGLTSGFESVSILSDFE